MSTSLSQKFCNFLELADHAARIARVFVHDVFQAVVNVVMHHRFLGVDDGIFDRLKLLRDIKTVTPLFQHGDNALDVAFDTLQPLDDRRVRSMYCHVVYHIHQDRIRQMRFQERFQERSATD